MLSIETVGVPVGRDGGGSGVDVLSGVGLGVGVPIEVSVAVGVRIGVLEELGVAVRV